jgi:ATP-dependent Clp protease protease subunit
LERRHPLVRQGGHMADDSASRLFDEQVRRNLYEKRIVVLDDPLTDDNGTLLMSQLVALATDNPNPIRSPSVTSACRYVSCAILYPSALALRATIRL